MSVEGSAATRRPRTWQVAFVFAIGLLVAVLAWFLGVGRDTAGQPTNAPGATTPSTTTTVSIATADATTEPPVTTPTLAQDDRYVRPFLYRWSGSDCLNGDVRSGQVQRVDCDVAHDVEVYRQALVDSQIVEFDAQAIQSYADEVCSTSLSAYVPTYETRGLSYLFVAPTEETWNNPEEPDRVVTCLLFSNEAQLVGRAG